MNNLPLTDETIWSILNNEIDDITVNQLVWECLGYRQTETGWDITQVAPEWSTLYPVPPNFIESRPATVQLTRSIPTEYKQLLKVELGFKGYKIGEFSPRETRRATVANWLLSYRKLRSLGD